MNVQPFSPNLTTKIAATATSQNIPIDPNNMAQVARVVTTGGNAYIRFTSNATDVATVAADMPIVAGSVEIFSKGNATRIVIVADTTATVWVTTGEGQ